MMANFEELKEAGIFPIGSKNDAYANVFTGQSYLNLLAQAPDGHFGVGNVTFEPGCCNHWHAHVGGYQILLVTGGQGLYQEEGKAAQLLKQGDVIVTHDGVKHWHGASKESRSDNRITGTCGLCGPLTGSHRAQPFSGHISTTL